MLYTPVKVTVAEDQLERPKSDLKKPFVSIKIRLKGKKGVDDEHTLLLTRAQIDSINRVRSAGKRKFKTIRMSKYQIKKNISHQGGFLSFLTGLAQKHCRCWLKILRVVSCLEWQIKYWERVAISV